MRSLGHRLDLLEGAFGGERKCRCRVGPEAVGKPWSQTVVLAHPGVDDSKSCPGCGGQRIVYLVHPGFPLDRECGCPECVRATEAAETPQPARASATKRRGTASPAPGSAPRTDPPSLPVAPKPEHTAEPPTKQEQPSEHPERAWESQRSRRRGSISRGIERREF